MHKSYTSTACQNPWQPKNKRKKFHLRNKQKTFRTTGTTANFKETPLPHMKTGQAAMIHVDALCRDFTWTIEAIGGATESTASLLFPENATGNLVRVVLKIPVRVKINHDS
jgi:multidrug resistance efflux pump